MKNCNQNYEKVQLYVDNEMSKVEKIHFERHMAECESCRNDYAELVSICSFIGSIHEEEPPSNFGSLLHERLVSSDILIHEENDEIDNVTAPKNKYKKLLNFSYSAAAILLIALLGRWGFISYNDIRQSANIQVNNFESSRDATSNEKFVADSTIINKELSEQANVNSADLSNMQDTLNGTISSNSTSEIGTTSVCETSKESSGTSIQNLERNSANAKTANPSKKPKQNRVTQKNKVSSVSPTNKATNDESITPSNNPTADANSSTLSDAFEQKADKVSPTLTSGDDTSSVTKNKISEDGANSEILEKSQITLVPTPFSSNNETSTGVTNAQMTLEVKNEDANISNVYNVVVYSSDFYGTLKKIEEIANKDGLIYFEDKSVIGSNYNIIDVVTIRMQASYYYTFIDQLKANALKVATENTPDLNLTIIDVHILISKQ